MNIIFLDMDGVVTSHRILMAKKLKIFDDAWDPVAVYALNNLCRDFDAKIVVSSTWRMRGSLCLDMMHDMGFERENFFMEDPFTPVSASGSRPEEITRWLMRRWHKMRNFIIFDDEDHGLSNQFGDRFIKTDMYNGLMFSNIQTAIKILSNSLNQAERKP